MLVRGSYSDGLTAQTHDVELSVRDDALVVSALEGGQVLSRIALSDLRRVPSSGAGGPTVLGTADSDQRVTFTNPALLDLIATYAPDLRRGLYARQRLRPVMLAALGAAFAFPLILYVLLPRLAETFAVFITPQTEMAMGDRTYPQVARALRFSLDGPINRCVATDGFVALQTVTARFEDQLDLPVPLRVEVWDHPVVNAIAMPGGRIVIFRGLLDQASGPDGVTGVLAHEIGHIANRDSVRLGLRAAGSAGILGLALGDFAGGTIALAIAEAVTSASHTREAEELADAFALDQLAALDIPAEGLAEFFEQLQPEEPHEHDSVLSHLATHPDLGARAANARARSVGTMPSMSDAEWASLQSICAEVEPILLQGDWSERLEDLIERHMGE